MADVFRVVVLRRMPVGHSLIWRRNHEHYWLEWIGYDLSTGIDRSVVYVPKEGHFSVSDQQNCSRPFMPEAEMPCSKILLFGCKRG